MRQIDAIADEHVEKVLATSPIAATQMGVSGHDTELDDLSPDGAAAHAELARDTSRRLRETEPVDERERIAKEGITERLDLILERYDAGDEFLDLNVLTSAAHGVRQVFDIMPAEGEHAVANIAARLSAVPTALRGYAETLRAEAAAGRVAAARQVDQVASHCDNWNGANGNDFWDGLVSRLRVAGQPPNGALAEELVAGARDARAATAEFARFLRTELAPHAPQNDGVGRERYARASRYFLGATVDLEETYAWGWEELHRIESEMAEVADAIKPGASVDEATAILDSDPALSIATKEEFRDWMQQLADTTVADLADKHFDIPEPLRRVDCKIAPTADGAIYYIGPSEDFSRPGSMWWSVPDGQDKFTTWREVTTVFHEGVPGHHLQIGQTAYQSERMNRYQRQMLTCSGNAEGWALYAERLMDDLGYLPNPGEKLGMLDGQGFRATRVIVDIGVHLGLTIPRDNPFGFHPGEKWNAELAWEFLRAHSRIEDDMLRFELNRYLGWPGQAPSYKVGERMWLAAREDYKRRKGEEYSLRKFHTDALNLGTMGLDPLRAALSRL